MQENQIKLKEIVWEITSKCNNNCSYCGSKGESSIPVDNTAIKHILREIVKYPPQQIDISGGDPLLVDYEVHEQIVRDLKEKGVEVKIVINPKSISNKPAAQTKINLYDWVGISINDLNDLKIVEDELTRENLTPENDWRSKYTVITNFNLSNLFFFEEIEAFIRRNNVNWMIQYTVYKDRENPLAIYNNDKALEQLREKIAKCNDGIKIIISDNANSFPCSAGTGSLGILHDGTVVPCLSMRSWANLSSYQAPSLLFKRLKEIWIEDFMDQRFGCFECCKDACKNKVLWDFKPKLTITESTEVDKGWEEFYKDAIKKLEGERNIVYGVRSITMMYAVFSPPQNDFFNTFRSTTTTNDEPEK